MHRNRTGRITVFCLSALFALGMTTAAWADSVSLRSSSEIASGNSDVFSTAIVNGEEVPVWEVSKEDKLVLEEMDLPFQNYRELSIGILYPQPDDTYRITEFGEGILDYAGGAGAYLTIDRDLSAGKEYDVYNLLRLYGDMGGHEMDECLFFMMFRYDKDGVDTVWTGDLYLEFVDVQSLAHQRAAEQGTAAEETKGTAAWAQNEKGWWVEYPDGSYLTNQWYQSPVSGLWYYMGADGYMMTNSQTPDGYLVDGNGVWIR